MVVTTTIKDPRREKGVDTRAFLKHLGLLDKYQNTLIANVGVSCPLSTLEKTLTLTNLPRMNIQDFDDQKVKEARAHACIWVRI